MKKHLPWIVVTALAAVICVGLHFFLFTPLKDRYNKINEDMTTSVSRLKSRIEMVDWIDETPDPRKPGFSWQKLLQEVEGTYESRLTDYRDLVESIDVALPAYPEDQSIDLALDRLRKIQELEEKNPTIHILEKWGLDVSPRGGYSGRGLDLRSGGYRSWVAEDRMDSQQGTIQFAVNMEPWFVQDPIENDPALFPRQVLFHAARQTTRPPGMPESVHPGFSSEILIERVGANLTAIARKTSPSRSPLGQGAGTLETAHSVDLYSLLLDQAGKTPWRIVRFSWGPNPEDNQIHIDGQPAPLINQQSQLKRSQLAQAERARAPQAAIPLGYGYEEDEYSRREGSEYGYGVGGGFRPPAPGRPGGVLTTGIELEPLDGFILGNDIKQTGAAPLVFDSLKVWDAVGGNSEPSKAPLFYEEFEHPFGDATTFETGVSQLVRFHENVFDPHNADDVKKQYLLLYDIQRQFVGLTGKGWWVDNLRTLAFFDHARQVSPRFADMERLSAQISLPIPDHDIRKHLVVFLDLTLDFLEGMLAANVDWVDSVTFLNWSNTVSDEPLKKSFKEAYDALEAEVQQMGAMGGMYGMYPGYGMYGSYGGYGGYGEGYGDSYYSREDEDPEEAKKRKEEMQKKREEEQQKQAEMMEKMQKLGENKQKLQLWKIFMDRNEVAPEFYITYREQAAAEGKDYFIRYSIKTAFKCAREKLANALYQIEYGKRLAFLSHLGLQPDVANEALLHVEANVEYNFMNEVEFAVAGQPGSATGAQAPSPPVSAANPQAIAPTSSAGAGL
jgi:hypothetical protein